MKTFFYVVIAFFFISCSKSNEKNELVELSVSEEFIQQVNQDSLNYLILDSIDFEFSFQFSDYLEQNKSKIIVSEIYVDDIKKIDSLYYIYSSGYGNDILIEVSEQKVTELINNKSFMSDRSHEIIVSFEYEKIISTQLALNSDFDMGFIDGYDIIKNNFWSEFNNMIVGRLIDFKVVD